MSKKATKKINAIIESSESNKTDQTKAIIENAIYDFFNILGEQ